MENLIAKLTNLAAHCARHAEIVLALLLMGIIFMMILPLPTPLVDALVGLNLCTSILLVVLSLYLPGPLAFSTFPAVLLVTTIFRLGISISTTRLILLTGDAGHIVETFGNFVVGGNLAVGLVIFMILIIVQFLVITKGSERVAEVSARFALDAMPGKQLSIDSDLRAGLLQPQDARKKRLDLAQESKLYGAMDGAMKFVKGDAIAGLIIVFVNLLGGLSIGIVQQGMPASEAMQLYSVLTIGDGLVSQIPALLIALTAGIIITRVTPDLEPGQEPENLGRSIAAQLGSQPRAWAVAGVAMFGFAWVPGMPTFVFLLISSTIGGTFGMQYWRARKTQAKPQVTESVEDLRGFTPVRPYLLRFSERSTFHLALLPFINALRQVRNQMVADYGLMLPSLELSFDETVPEGEYIFCLYEVPHLSGRFDVEDITQIQTNLKELFFQTASGFIGIQEASALITWLENEQPELAKEVQRLLPNSSLATVLQRLAAERVSLRNIKLIAQALAEWGKSEQDPMVLTEYVRLGLRHQICHALCPDNQLHTYILSGATEAALRQAMQHAPDGNFAFDPELFFRLLDALRQRMQPVASDSLTSPPTTAEETPLSATPETIASTVTSTPVPTNETAPAENAAEESAPTASSPDQTAPAPTEIPPTPDQAAPLPPETATATQEKDTKKKEPDLKAIVLLVAQDLRRHIRLFVEQESLRCTVLAFPELLPEVRVNVLGQIELIAQPHSMASTQEEALEYEEDDDEAETYHGSHGYLSESNDDENLSAEAASHTLDDENQDEAIDEQDHDQPISNEVLGDEDDAADDSDYAEDENQDAEGVDGDGDQQPLANDRHAEEDQKTDTSPDENDDKGAAGKS